MKCVAHNTECCTTCNAASGFRPFQKDSPVIQRNYVLTPQVWCTEDGDLIVVGTHDVALARTLAEAEVGEPLTDEPGQGWVMVGRDEHGEFWRHVNPGTPGAIPSCGW